ncbi:MAG: hypothetical protein JO112_02485 [Planctomycetes bacterium]|nr:hypothetical protein [Planctomycetota bacterium]
MQTLEIGANHVIVRLTQHELVILNNALNEVCNGIEVPEFSIRMGAELQTVVEVLRQINGLIAVMEKQMSDSPSSG